MTSVDTAVARTGTGLQRDHAKETGEITEPEQIAAKAAACNATCKVTLNCYEEWLARALAAAINHHDPDAIVLGGGLSNLDRLYENVPDFWSAHVFSDQIATKLIKNRHGDASGVRGAAWLQ